ncbi:MAG: EamA family transporter [Candidatus Latescibacteria bacterium]|nr:EamA family transporter [Candidatus Latescibacterota bacterium]NIO27228.1 EamA family transporter [Candidatus Latescibacterota bacterium]NIO54752.1 EamA family transporter [Candidatus Latescibacterota bacterium]NIT00835.1 EamA family transporter [Candidatus Latescibacterota bacterium]NIT37758.1 EamA family transporter [Candidatus Latescibacterota bacterium]
MAPIDGTGIKSGVLQLVFGACLISFSAVFVKLAHVGPTVSAFYRAAFGAALLIPLVFARREALWRGAIPFLLGVGCGVLFALDLSCWHRSILYIGPGLATILGNFQVFVLAVVGILVFRETITWKFVAAIPLAMLGLFFLVGIQWEELGTNFKLGVLFALLTAVIYAIFILVLKKSQSILPRLTPIANLFLLSAAAASVMALEIAAEGESFGIPDPQTWASLLGLGVISQVVGWVLISGSISKVETSRIGLILLLQPTLTFIWDMLFFGRPTTAIEIVGALTALSAIYLGGARKR